MVRHLILPGSPLHGVTPEDVMKDEMELVIEASGVDDTSLQMVHARHRWFARSIAWGARHADVLSDSDDGKHMILDLRRFNELVATEPTEGFPYRHREPR